MRAKKFERTLSLFFSDPFIDVALPDRKVPNEIVASTLPPTHRMPQPRFKGLASSRPWRGRGTRLPTHLPNPP